MPSVVIVDYEVLRDIMSRTWVLEQPRIRLKMILMEDDIDRCMRLSPIRLICKDPLKAGREPQAAVP